ncbi:hypothetical protein V6O07_21330, partial [Arthrospira platensis SPKY2]
MTNLTGSGAVDFAKFLGNASDTVNLPSFSWTDDLDTGIYRPVADQLAITTGGVQRALFSSAGITGNLVGNASTSTRLQTARLINGVSFDGSEDITISSTLSGTLIKGTGLSGNNFNGTVDTIWAVVYGTTAGTACQGDDSRLSTNLGVTAGTTAGPIITSSTGTNATIPTASATGSGIVTTGNQTWAGTKTFNAVIVGSINGNAATATTLQTARTINGTSFNGSANITITANTPNILTRGTGLTGNNFNGGAATTWAVAYGTTAGTACQGNDSRLSDARTPTAHTHEANDITSGIIDVDRLPAAALIGDTTYSAGSGLTLSGTTFSLPVATSGSGTFVT